MKRRNLVRRLRAHGAEKLREGGRHSLWRSADGRTGAIPRHREVGVGLIKKDLQGPGRPAARGPLSRRRGWTDPWKPPRKDGGAEEADAEPPAGVDEGSNPPPVRALP